MFSLTRSRPPVGDGWAPPPPSLQPPSSLSSLPPTPAWAAGSSRAVLAAAGRFLPARAEGCGDPDGGGASRPAAVWHGGVEPMCWVGGGVAAPALAVGPRGAAVAAGGALLGPDLDQFGPHLGWSGPASTHDVLCGSLEVEEGRRRFLGGGGARGCPCWSVATEALRA